MASTEFPAEASAGPVVYKPQFISHTMPDIQPGTHILAVCGITTLEQADPTREGMFFSDFFLFYHLLLDVSQDQSWLVSNLTTPQELVKHYAGPFGPSPFVHGDPQKTRKVVLDNRLVEKGVFKKVQSVDRTWLKGQFLLNLRRMSQAAEKDHRPILVLIFSHGSPDSFELAIGDTVSAAGQLVPNNLTMEEFKDAAKGAKVCLLTPACFSGGWAINPDLNYTVAAGAGPLSVSWSWDHSGSLGRACGNIFLSSVVESMVKEADYDLWKQTQKEEFTRQYQEEHTKTWKEFAEAVDQIMTENSDGYVHDIRFSAQDDDWKMKWNKRSGIALSHYKARWDNLSDYPPSGVNSGASGAASGADSSQLAYGFMAESTRSLVKIYLKSHPMRDNVVPNVGLHGRCRMLLEGEKKFTFDELAAISKPVMYRMELMDQAQYYLSAAGIPFPRGQLCTEFDYDNYVSSEACKDQRNKVEGLWGIIRQHRLFDNVSFDIASWMIKPLGYIHAGLLHSNVSRQQAEDALKAMSKLKADATEKLRQHLTSDESSIKPKMNQLLRSIGKLKRSLSPRKSNESASGRRSKRASGSSETSEQRRSRGLSDTMKRLSLDSKSEKKKK